jgi:hypothetical protein
MRSPLFAPALAVALFVLTGCSRGGEVASPYELEPTRTCLVEADLRVAAVPQSDFVASTASGGAVRVRFADIRVTLTFGADEAEASRTEQAYRRFAPRRLPIDDVLRRERNVVELWEFAPTIDHLNTLNGCLKS